VLAKQVHVRVVGDRERIGQALINLLTNAVKYSPQADRVLIRMARDEQQVTVSVQDFGVGIALAHQHKIFDRYYQVSDSAKRPFSGLGLGLYLAHEIIKAHDGSLLLESEEGKGSTFSFTLPVLGQEAE
jgi:signal transduction histidine kinase